jgi:hypothetical protein
MVLGPRAAVPVHRPTDRAPWPDDGLAAYGRGDYATALQEWLPLAEQGDAVAQYNLGVMYANGWGVPENDAEAATLR